jgi:hypothetical protein
MMSALPTLIPHTEGKDLMLSLSKDEVRARRTKGTA